MAYDNLEVAYKWQREGEKNSSGLLKTTIGVTLFVVTYYRIGETAAVKNTAVLREMGIREFGRRVGVSGATVTRWLDGEFKGPKLFRGERGKVLTSDFHINRVRRFVRVRARCGRVHPRSAQALALADECSRGLQALKAAVGGGVVHGLDVGFDAEQNPVPVEMHPGVVTADDCPFCGRGDDTTNETVFALVGGVLVRSVEKAAADCDGNVRVFLALLKKAMGDSYAAIGKQLGVSKQAVGKYRRTLDRNNRELGKFFGVQHKER